MKTPIRSTLALLLLTATLTPGLRAQDVIFYTGPDVGTWTVEANWAGGTRPSASQLAGINNASGTPIGVNPSATVGGIVFSSTENRGISIGSGRMLTLGGVAIPGTPLISHSGSQTANLSGNGSLLFSVAGSVHAVAGTTITFSSRIAPGSMALEKTGAGRVNFFNTGNAFSSAITITGGSLATNQSSTMTDGVLASGPFGIGLVTLNEGTSLHYVASSSDGMVHNALRFRGGISLGDGTQSRAVTYAGAVELEEATLAIGQKVTFSGVVSNGPLRKEGSSELVLSAANTYLGGTTVREGTLTLAGDGTLGGDGLVTLHAGTTLHQTNDYTFATGRTLTGEGRLLGDLLLAGGEVAPGLDATGDLHVEGGARLESGTLTFELAPDRGDRLVFTGDGMSLEGNTTGAIRLQLRADAPETLGSSYLLLSTAGLTNASFEAWDLAAFTLQSLPEGWSATLRMDEHDLYVDFQAIPEPSVTWLLGGLGLAALLLRRPIS